MSLAGITLEEIQVSLGRRDATSSLIVGIDPGLKGALAALHVPPAPQRPCLADVIDMPVAGGEVSPVLVGDWLRTWSASCVLVVIEKVHSMPEQGVASSFNFGRSRGVLEGACGALALPVELPSPAGWKKDMKLSKDKDGARHMALKMWPQRSDLFQRVKDDGRAEACLMAEWGRRVLAERGGGE